MCESEGAGARAWGSGSTSGVQGRTRLGGCGGRARGGERTWNIKRIFVTRDVSKFTGWLKASALCRVEKAGHAMRGERCVGRKAGELGRGAAASANAARTRRPRDWRGRARAAERTENM